MYVILLILSAGGGYALWDFYQTAPRFLFALDEQLLANPAVVQTIGEKTATTYTYGKHVLAEGDSAAFSCTITGRCDSAYVKVTGYYFKRNDQLVGVVTDTILKAACQY
jgi:hypothetical protein